MTDSSIPEKCCSIGEMVQGDPSHFMIERTLGALGLDWRFLTFQLPQERLADALAGVAALGFRGVRLLGQFRDTHGLAPERLSERSRQSGRVSHLLARDASLVGDDVTGAAACEALATAGGGEPAGKRAVLLGALGAGPSLALTLVERGVASLAVADRDADAAERLAGAARSWADALVARGALADSPAVTIASWDGKWIELPECTDWLLSTACWPKSENQAVADSVSPELTPQTLVVDLGVGSSRAPLLRAADRRGARVLDGLAVLVAETARVLEAWRGAPVDRAPLRDAGEEFLGI